MITVLIVEDEASLQDSLSDMLAINGYGVVTANNGQEGLQQLQAHNVDLVLCDIMMPVMDGYEFVKHVRANAASEVLPVIFLTARVEFESKLKGLELGADDYITKPFAFRELSLKIRNLVHRQRKLVGEPVGAETPNTISQEDALFLKKLDLLLSEQLHIVNMSTSDVASMLNMSLSTFSRKLKKASGKVPNQYIRTFRLERARQMMHVGYGNLSEIAAASGFSSLSYFSTCYKEHFGVSPSDHS